MLVDRHEEHVVHDVWESAQIQVELPSEIERTFFTFSGPMRGYIDSRRMYHRYYLRCKALLRAATS